MAPNTARGLKLVHSFEKAAPADAWRLVLAQMVGMAEGIVDADARGREANPREARRPQTGHCGGRVESRSVA